MKTRTDLVAPIPRFGIARTPRAPGHAGCIATACALLVLGAAPRPAAADLPAPSALLAELGLSKDEIAQVEAGKLVRYPGKPASERELTAGLAFEVPVSPAVLVDASKRDLLDQVDPNMLGFGTISAAATPADFAKLTLAPDPGARAKAWSGAGPGGALNLSSAEIAAFGKLGSGASPAAVETQIRVMLADRVQAYRTKGLAGIAPYARGGGQTRSAGDELRAATRAFERLAKYAPAAHRFLLSYPNERPPGTQEIMRWSRFDAHGTPTIALTQVLLIPDGDAWLAAQRQFYVSTGYNAEQSIAAFLPIANGSVVIYANHTSTDQITGLGGGAKRSLGSKLLASQLETMFERARGRLK
jgi:hypothetical protein